MNFGIVLLITEAEGILNCPLITNMHDDSIKFGIKSHVKTNCSNHERVSCKQLVKRMKYLHLLQQSYWNSMRGESLNKLLQYHTSGKQQCNHIRGYISSLSWWCQTKWMEMYGKVVKVRAKITMPLQSKYVTNIQYINIPTAQLRNYIS